MFLCLPDITLLVLKSMYWVLKMNESNVMVTNIFKLLS